MTERVIFRSNRTFVNRAISEADLDRIVESTNQRIADRQPVIVKQALSGPLGSLGILYDVGRVNRVRRDGDTLIADMSIDGEPNGLGTDDCGKSISYITIGDPTPRTHKENEADQADRSVIVE